MRNQPQTKHHPRRRLLLSWITPAVVSVVLPAHAVNTNPPPRPNILHRNMQFGLQLLSCSSSNITVRICNNELFDVEIVGAHVEQYPPKTGSWLLTLKTTSHNTPFTIPLGECVNVSFSRQSTRSYWCGSPWRIEIFGHSQDAVGEYDRIAGSAAIPLWDDSTATSTPLFV